ncbi:MAG: c-type cytochrome [Flavobacteriia bacterium]|jgi:cytochrome c6
MVGFNKLLFFSSILVLFSCSSKGSVKENNELVENEEEFSGKELYLQQCALCHGEDGKLGASGAKDLSVSKLDAAGMRSIIMKGKNGMPPMQELLGSEENVRKVIEHIQKLKK